MAKILSRPCLRRIQPPKSQTVTIYKGTRGLRVKNCRAAVYNDPVPGNYLKLRTRLMDG